MAEIVVKRAVAAGQDGGEVRFTPVKLGQRVRALRRQRGWSLITASEHVSLSRSALSKVERDEMSPTFTVMQKLAHGFGLGLIEFLNPDASQRQSGRRVVVRADGGDLRETPNYGLRFLGGEDRDSPYFAAEVTFKACSLKDFPDWDRHDNEDLIYILAGEVTFYSEQYEPVRLVPGDSVYFDARMGHAFTSPDGKSRALWITNSQSKRPPSS